MQIQFFLAPLFVTLKKWNLYFYYSLVVSKVSKMVLMKKPKEAIYETKESTLKKLP